MHDLLNHDPEIRCFAGRTFASVFEGKEYPVYGTQFHPEKNNFEWVKVIQAVI